VVVDEADRFLRACIIVAYDTAGELALQDGNKKFSVGQLVLVHVTCMYMYINNDSHTYTSRSSYAPCYL
jgi:hypothetical protein